MKYLTRFKYIKESWINTGEWNKSANATTHTVKLNTFIRKLEDCLGVKAEKNYLPMQDGDVRKSHADIENLIRNFDYAPKWNLQDGIKSFVQWYVDYYKVNLPVAWVNDGPGIVSNVC